MAIRFASGVGLSENRDRREGQVVGTVSPKGVSVGLGVRVLRDNVTGETVSSGGRSFARTKTKEDKAQLFYTEIQMQFDFSDVKGPRRLGVGPRRQVPETGSKPIGATVARPPAGEAAAAGFWPPARVQETRALGGMDVVTDVHALDKSLKPSASGVSALLGTKDDRTSLEAWGSGLPDWPTVRKDILAHLTMSSLQRDLKAMMVGKGIEVPLEEPRERLDRRRGQLDVISARHQGDGVQRRIRQQSGSSLVRGPQHAGGSNRSDRDRSAGRNRGHRESHRHSRRRVRPRESGGRPGIRPNRHRAQDEGPWCGLRRQGDADVQPLRGRLPGERHDQFSGHHRCRGVGIQGCRGPAGVECGRRTA